MNVNSLLKLLAFLMWADEKVEENEWEEALAVARKYNISEAEAKEKISTYIEELLEKKEDEEETETENELLLELEDIGEVDNLELFKDSLRILGADGIFDISEVEIAHLVGDALNLEKEIITIAMLLFAKENNVDVKLTIEEDTDNE